MVHPTPSYLLDISRLISRAGRGVNTGIDRVEWAYVRHFLALDVEVHFLSKGLGGFVLLRRQGMERLMPYLNGEEPWGRKDLLSRLGGRQSDALKRAEATMRRLSAAQTPRPALAAMLQRRLGPGFTYLNVGHINQAGSTLDAVRKGGARKIVLMVHDVIPLEYPEFARPDGASKFEEKLRVAADKSDVLIFNSHDTARRTNRALAGWGIERPYITAHLGLDAGLNPIAQPIEAPERPHFVALGTIEPRKNHLLLLNIWRRFTDTLPEQDIPHLHIVGRRGWENENIIDQLDRAPFMGNTVFERGTLPDDALAPLLASARALLFPSFAEGYGYPLIEALTQGSPVIASDLAAFREIGGDHVTYLDPLDGPGWAREIMAAADRPRARPQAFEPPDWPSHFKILQGYLEERRDGGL